MVFLQPDRYFSRVTSISVQHDLLGRGFTSIIMDVDNTLLTRDDHHVPRDVMSWLSSVRAAGIEVCLLSNNFHEGVIHLADRLELPIVAKAVKPLPHGFLMALNKLHAKRSQTVVVGDQLITDVFGAHFLGMTAYMVCPLVETDLWHTLLLRKVERVILGDKKPAGTQSEPEGVTCDTSNL